MALYTFEVSKKEAIEKKLTKMQVDYMFMPVTDRKINVFFGAKACVDVIRTIGQKRLCDYTCEEDFILGIMLGYDRLKQCERYIEGLAKRAEKRKRLPSAPQNIYNRPVDPVIYKLSPA